VAERAISRAELVLLAAARRPVASARTAATPPGREHELPQGRGRQPEKSSIELRYVQKIEAADQGVSLDVLVRLADALATTPDRLLPFAPKLPKPRLGGPPRARRGRAKK
jgi:hypothetical protein